VPATVAFPVGEEGQDPLGSLEATVVDVSPGGVCMRLEMDDRALDVMRRVEEGLYVEVDVKPALPCRYRVLGRIAWAWVPTMEGEDRVGSLGVDVLGVAEEDRSLLGKARRLLVPERVVSVERASRLVKTRKRKAAEENDPVEGPAEPDDQGTS
jgi:hypothetical protein